GRRILLAEMDRQILADGGHVERSTHYLRYTLDFYLLALAVARIAGDPVAASFSEAVARLATAARLLADDRGRLPNIGDEDAGAVLRICRRPPDGLRGRPAIAAALTGRPDLRIGPLPEEYWWMLTHPALAVPAPETGSARPPASGALPETGYFISRSSAGDHIVVDCGPHGYRNGGHAHADALS